VATTVQEKRGHGRVTLSPRGATPQQPQPFAVPLNRNVPSLAVMTKGAIHCLENNPQGFYLMIEGGAVDWANHANEQERMVEEQIDYVKAVEAVVAWVDAHSNWNDTLVILTADHETGLLWGPDSAKVAFQPLKDRGPGKLPGMKHKSHGHSNSLVPLYARGPGSERFAALQRGQDSHAAVQWHYDGHYVDNTDVFAVMRAEVVKPGAER
jgi:alkaline phosphatase